LQVSYPENPVHPVRTFRAALNCATATGNCRTPKSGEARFPASFPILILAA
jgi:hypothetical protein